MASASGRTLRLCLPVLVMAGIMQERFLRGECQVVRMYDIDFIFFEIVIIVVIEIIISYGFSFFLSILSIMVDSAMFGRRWRS